MSTRICVTFGDNESVIFPDGLRASEVEQVRDWTKGRIGSRQAFFDAIASEDNDALRALRLLNLRRRGGQERFDDVNIEFDGYDAYFIDDSGREIEPDIVYDDEGDPVMKNVGSVDNPVWRPKVHKNEDGRTDRWVYTDSREVVPAAVPTKRRAGKATTSVTTPDIQS